MPLLKLDAGEARDRLENKHAFWWKPGIDVENRRGRFAVQRRNHEVFVPSLSGDWTKTLEVSRADPVFAVGSCFARGIEVALRSRDFQVLSYAAEFDDFELASPNVTGRGFTNKYSSFSIENELTWALDAEAQFPVESLVEVAEDTVVDPHVNPTLKWLDLASTIARRNIISEVYGRAAQAPLIVITLGLVETWTDLQERVRLNMAPTSEMVSLNPGRYQFEVTGFAENRDALDRISRLLNEHGHPDTQIVVTVSPVPLRATFSGRDVVAANAYSKSVLRAAAEEWCFDEPNVHYFPSYEIVTNSASDNAWKADGRHVQHQAFSRIMSLFTKTFVTDP